MRPSVFGRRRFGMTPVLPQILDHLQFTGVVHATLDDGRFPAGNTSRQRWEGIDGTTVEAILRVPVDGSRSEGFLRMPHALSGVADMDNQPTVIFAHWPGQTSPWYEDVRRARRYTTVLGSFRTVSDYFERTGISGHQTAPKADEYRSPYLKQAVAAGQANPISRWVRYYERRAAAEAAETIATLATLACGRPSTCAASLLEAIDDSLATPADDVSLDERVADLGRTATADFARSIGGIVQDSLDDPPAGKDAVGIVVTNPLSFSRRVPRRCIPSRIPARRSRRRSACR